MSASFAIPRIDVDLASRDSLIAHIDALEAALSNAYPPDSEVTNYQYAFGLTFSEATILAGIVKRGRATREYLRDVSFRWGDRDNCQNIDVLMVRVRRKLKPLNVEIGIEWGVGFQIDPDNLQRLRSLLSERAAA